MIVESLPQSLPIAGKRPKTCQSPISSFCIKTDSARAIQLDLQIARFFYACNIPFNIVEHKELKAMILFFVRLFSSKQESPENVHERKNEYVCEQT